MASVPTIGTSKNRYIAPFKPLPWQVAPWRDKSPVMLLTGSAGGGKSRLAAEKVHGYCKKYPGATWLMMRKAREWCGKSILPFYAQTVVGRDPDVRLNKSDGTFYYRNGSVVYTGGMLNRDQREAVRSIGGAGGLDGVWLEEATAFTKDDFEEVIARVRHTATDWRQVILTTNPDAPTHWIYTQLIQNGGAKVYYSHAADNTYNPDDYRERLNNLSGVLAQRMREGKWVQASGTVFEGIWSDAECVTASAEYEPGAGPVLWAVDDGYAGERTADGYTANSHPRVFLLCQLRGDGCLNVFAESHAVKKLADVHLQEVVALPYPMPEYAGVDKSAAELRGRMHNLGIYTRAGPPSVEESLKVLADWLGADSNGVRKIHVHPRCTLLRGEMLAYRRDADGGIVKEFDHAVDGLRYLVWALRHAA